MFAYNPTVNDRSGEILAQGIMQQNANRASQQQQIAETIGSAIASLGIIIKKKQEDAAKAATIGEALSTMQSVLPTYGKEGAALANIITQRVEASGNNLDKMSGILMSAKPAMDDLSARYNQKAQIDGYKELYTQRAQVAADAKAALPPKMNAETIRSMVSEAKQVGFSDDAIKAKLQSQYGDWAVRSVYPPQNQGIWMGQ